MDRRVVSSGERSAGMGARHAVAEQGGGRERSASRRARHDGGVHSCASVGALTRRTVTEVCRPREYADVCDLAGGRSADALTLDERAVAGRRSKAPLSDERRVHLEREEHLVAGVARRKGAAQHERACGRKPLDHGGLPWDRSVRRSDATAGKLQ